ncbi:uncharacterized protein LOC110451829 [Mizuhopecten yessoensis]|uniref:uncharacterized protein LOC110451829 n=1 Tax=Mizuhopecten yessoensis TaxID=6573 RepID=UPI000B45E025|nr:uncharacterized protein LOC110451829 [Mizuhopecten yessoensis]XP_021355714.1 uncharacterized protein LOC110451829 [Mizuhopecten yessoensis]
MVALAHHLFSQLVPGKKYEVDKYAKQIPKQCDCGCKARICEGNTSLGSLGTWHGRVDILLNHTIAVAFLQELTDKDDEGETDDSGEDSNEDEPRSKQRKMDSCGICVKEKTAKKHDNILLDQKVMKQILAEAITNGFAQVNMNSTALSHFLIPTFGTTSEHVTICLYDSENDYLLHIQEHLELWCPGEMSDQLNVMTIVVIWLFLNFVTFTQKKLHNVVDLDKSGLHQELKGRLDYYKKATTKGNFVSPTSGALMWTFLNPTAKPRKNFFDHLNCK